MKGDTQVSKLMTWGPETVAPTDSARTAQKVMLAAGVHHVPVVEGARFVGMISTNDLLRVALGDSYRDDPDVVAHDLEQLSVREVMIEDVASVQMKATVRDAAQRLTSGSFHALPVLDGDTLVGILTSTDLIAYLIEDDD
jgi:CBS domain-containing protein